MWRIHQDDEPKAPFGEVLSHALAQAVGFFFIQSVELFKSLVQADMLRLVQFFLSDGLGQG
jgi:hypothetical protein